MRFSSDLMVQINLKGDYGVENPQPGRFSGGFVGYVRLNFLIRDKISFVGALIPVAHGSRSCSWALYRFNRQTYSPRAYLGRLSKSTGQHSWEKCHLATRITRSTKLVATLTVGQPWDPPVISMGIFRPTAEAFGYCRSAICDVFLRSKAATIDYLCATYVRARA